MRPITHFLILAALGLAGLAAATPLGRALVLEGWDRGGRLLRPHAREAVSGPEIPVELRARLEAAGLDPRNGVHLRVYKDPGVVEVWIASGQSFTRFASLPVCRFSGDLGPKLREGDGQSPEGFYRLTEASLNPKSAHFLSMDLGFPNPSDRAKGRTGSLLMIHDGCLSVGCYAMTDSGISQIYPLVQASIRAGHTVPVHAFPHPMEPARLDRAGSSPWRAEWETLAKGWALFARDRRPPDVSFCGAETVFERRRGCLDETGKPI